MVNPEREALKDKVEVDETTRRPRGWPEGRPPTPEKALIVAPWKCGDGRRPRASTSRCWLSRAEQLREEAEQAMCTIDTPCGGGVVEDLDAT